MHGFYEVLQDGQQNGEGIGVYYFPDVNLWLCDEHGDKDYHGECGEMRVVKEWLQRQEHHPCQ